VIVELWCSVPGLGLPWKDCYRTRGGGSGGESSGTLDLVSDFPSVIRQFQSLRWLW
jgi:hypothetical protein